MVNAFYGQDISMEVLWGDFGTNITKVDDTTYEVLPPADGTSDPSTWKWTSTMADIGPSWIRADLDVTLPTDLAEAVEQSAPLADAVAEVDPEQDVFPPYIKMTAEDLSTIALNNTAILNLSQTRFAEFITSGGIEEGWDEYVEQLGSAGLDQNIEIHQRYYDEQSGT